MPDQYTQFNKTRRGFTLIELLVAFVIFAIIASLSYRAIATLVRARTIITSSQTKWNALITTINHISDAWHSAVALPVRDEDGNMMSAVLGKSELKGQFDALLELTTNGYIRDDVYGMMPPKRLGFRFSHGTIYLVTWPVLNRLTTTRPRMYVLATGIAKFSISYLYNDDMWRDTWPLDNFSFYALPRAIKVYLKTDHNEEITRIIT